MHYHYPTSHCWCKNLTKMQFSQEYIPLWDRSAVADILVSGDF